MAQQKTAGISIEDLKKSLKTLSSEMNPEQLKRANETLEKLESVSAKNNEENVEIQKTNIKIQKSLDKTGPINKSLLELQKLYKDSNKENSKNNKLTLAKLDKLAVGSRGDLKRVLPIKEDAPLTVREGLKAGVAGVKGAVSSIGGGIKAIGSGIKDVFTKPSNVIGKVKSTVSNAFESGKEFVTDVATTKKGYDVRKERVADRIVQSEEGQKRAAGSLMDPKDKAKLDKRVAEVSYEKMAGAETKLLDINKKIKEFESSGVSAPKELIKQKQEQEKIQREADIRPKDAPVSKKQKDPNIQKAAPATAEGPSEKANEAAEKSSIESLTKARSENPEADNVVSANEKMSDSMKELAQTSKELLDTTKESVDILKGIRSDLASDDVQPLRSKPVEGSAPAEAAAAEGGSLLGTAMDLGGDLLDRGKGKPKGGFPRGKAPSVPAKAGLGSRMMGGIKSVGGKLGGMAKGAAGVLGKLAVPLAVATAGYDAYKGVERAGENFDLKEGEEATLGQKTSSALGSVASGFSFGMVDEKEAAQGINKAGSAVKDFFGFGDKETSQKFPLKDEGPKGGLDPNDSNEAEYRASLHEEFRRDAEDIKKFAKGGPVKGGGAENGADYLVGEEGPELFVPFKDGVVIPNDISQKLAPAAIKGGIRGLAEGGIVKGAGQFSTKYMEDGTKVSFDPATGGKTVYDADGKTSYNVTGQKTSYQTPSIGGFYKSTNYETGEKTITGQVGPVGISATQRPDQSTVATGEVELGDVTTRSSTGIGFGGAGKDVQQGGNQVTSVTTRTAQNLEGTTSSFVGKPTDQQLGNVLKEVSNENASMRDEMSAKGGSSQPIVMNNSSNNSTTKIMPMKADPRPSDRGSAYERHLERTSAY